MKFYGEKKIDVVTNIVSSDHKLNGTWTSYIKPSLWHWDIKLGYFKIKWYHYLLPPLFPPKNGV